MQDIQGTHLIVDGYVEDSSAFTEATIFSLFDQLVETFDMEYLTPPCSAAVPFDSAKLDESKDEGGTSYWCQITTSHISLHAWPLRQAFMMDIFSCLLFDTDLAMEIINNHLCLTGWRLHILNRQDPKILDAAGSSYQTYINPLQ
jgi:S-adenosylmethionine/arginine decarboxylase-like enzyme